MDQTDKRIVAILEGNGRTSAAEVGRQIGLSRTAVQDRVTRLEAAGVIEGYRAIVSQEDGSLIRAVLFVTIAVRPCAPALDWLSSLTGVQEVLSLSGDVDALVRCAVPNVAALTTLNDRIGQSDLVVRSTSHIVLKTVR
ncbi:Lrp/AsnC family transcriptional regulator [Thalassobius sp. Cn5-15]|uniref:Lrp/AsnC family transcriptional regulator n=1 Tax=Thalassobius sp. Cn5-15 TaxID=2917763 RepID=UPI001EF172DB|nr:Lrp/AsnC family transcriptional regulator [Thalassobius sp. Cn5-15]